MRGTELTEVEKARILAFVQDKVPTKEIMARTGRSKSAITKLVRDSRLLPPNVIPQAKSRPGRPSKISASTSKLLKRELFKQPTLSAVQLKKLHPQLLGSVAVRTLQEHLQKKCALPSRVAAKKPLLTEPMRRKRLQFARNYSHYTKDDWAKVMWSDESAFKCFMSRPGRVRRPRGSDRYDPRFTVKTVKHSDGVMIWGAFTGALGRAGLYFLPKNTTMNSERYQKVLEDHLLPFYDIHGATVFQHDSAPCHRAKTISKYLSDNNIAVLQWPGNSPDINPIENAWNLMKEKLKDRDTSSVPRLIKAIKDIWINNMSVDYFRTLSDSMPGRLEMVIKKKGHMTRY